MTQEDVLIKNEQFDEDDENSDKNINMADVDISDEISPIKDEVADEDDDDSKEKTNIKTELVDEDDDSLIKAEPVDDGDLIIFDGDGNIEVKEELGIKEEKMSDVDEEDIEVYDISLIKRRKRPKTQRKLSNVPPLGIIQELQMQPSEDQNKVNRKSRIKETPDISLSKLLDYEGERQKALNTDPGNTYTVAVALVKQFICDICDRPFNLKKNLVRHIQNHPQLFSCTYCTYKTKQKHHLNRHINSIHTKNISFNCTYCDYSAFQKHQLNQHINSKHTKARTYSCSHCNFRTYRKGDLSQHVNSIHIKAVFYTCTYCNYKTHRTGNLTRHVNALHTKQKSYSCSYCTFKTYDKSTFNKHVQDKHKKYFNETFCNLISYYNKEVDEFVKLGDNKKKP